MTAGVEGMQRALQGEDKAEYVNEMFDRIARRYDLMNRIMTVGRDQIWRRRAVALACIPPCGQVLDLATGTGDLALAVFESVPTATVVGADFSLPMMHYGQQKESPSHRRPRFLGADALHLPFPDESFDAVMSAFLMRNVTDIEAGFAEQYRVLADDGRLVCLEITMPQLPGFRQAFEVYFGRVVPVVGGLISGSRDAYTYLPESVKRFPQPAQLAGMLLDAGFRDVTYERLMLGTVAIHAATK